MANWNYSVDILISELTPPFWDKNINKMEEIRKLQRELDDTKRMLIKILSTSYGCEVVITDNVIEIIDFTIETSILDRYTSLFKTQQDELKRACEKFKSESSVV